MRMLPVPAAPPLNRSASLPANPWPGRANLPRHAAAVLAALHLNDPRLDACAALSGQEWNAALDYADRERCTLALRAAARSRMPEAVRARVDADAQKNQVRLKEIERTYRELVLRFGEAGIDFVLLKGITHAGVFGPGSFQRVQYDLDFWLPREHAYAAQRLLLQCGYEQLPGTEKLPTDHLPALARKTGWQWRGDFFDPEIPLPVELHLQFWNQRLDRFPAPGVEEFWERRGPRRLAGTHLPALHPADTVAYAALHVLKHVLHGSVRVFHVYELAAMLHARAGDNAFWEEWRHLHAPGLRRLQLLAFQLARCWFGGEVAPLVEAEMAELSARQRIWFEAFAASPVEQAFHSNKDQLWLHLSLLDSRRDAWAIAALRLFPRRLPVVAGDSFVAGGAPWYQWLRWRLHWAGHTIGRVWHHVSALPGVLRSAIRWWLRTR